MKKNIIFLFCSLLGLSVACSDDSESIPAPTLVTGKVTNIYSSEATIEGQVSIPKGSGINEYGILYSTEKAMEYAVNAPANSKSGESFTVQLTGLTPNTTYFYCTYATGNFGAAQGEIKNFITKPSTAPLLGELIVSNKTETGFNITCSIEDNGGYKPTSMGFYWKEVQSPTDVPTEKDNNIPISNSNPFSYQFKDVSVNSVYAIRAYATNQEGTTYGKTIYVALKDTPIISSCEQIGISGTTLSLKATIIANSDGITEKGFCHSNTKQEPTIDNIKAISTSTETLIQADIEDMNDDDQHFIRAYCIKDGVAYYSEVFIYGTRRPGIYSLEDLVAFRDARNAQSSVSQWMDSEKVINLYVDIDMSDIENWNPIEEIYLHETFNGNGHILTNLKMNYKEEWKRNSYGFIRTNKGTIKNLHIGAGSQIYFDKMNCEITCGSICAYNELQYVNENLSYRGTIKNCSSSTSIYISSQDGSDNFYIGGITGSNAGIIQDCTNSGYLEGTSKNSFIGGIAATCNTGYIQHCSNTANLGQGHECYCMGGIVALGVLTVQSCTNTGLLNGGSQSEYVGGIAGKGQYKDGFYSSIDQCTNEGKILNGKTYVGGIIGYLSGSITICTNKGNIVSEAKSIGSICGYVDTQNVFTGNTNSGNINGGNGMLIGTDNRGPALGKTTINNITTTSVHLESSILDEGGSQIIEEGFCYSPDAKEPDIYYDSTIKIPTEGHNMAITLDKLLSGTRYYIRSYAINSKGLNYGETTNFTTLPQ